MLGAAIASAKPPRARGGHAVTIVPRAAKAKHGSLVARTTPKPAEPITVAPIATAPVEAAMPAPVVSGRGGVATPSLHHQPDGKHRHRRRQRVPLSQRWCDFSWRSTGRFATAHAATMGFGPVVTYTLPARACIRSSSRSPSIAPPAAAPASAPAPASHSRRLRRPEPRLRRPELDDLQRFPRGDRNAEPAPYPAMRWTVMRPTCSSRRDSRARPTTPPSRPAARSPRRCYHRRKLTRSGRGRAPAPRRRVFWRSGRRTHGGPRTTCATRPITRAAADRSGLTGSW